MENLGDIIMPELCPRFYCSICDYKTCKKSSYDNHNNSKKHKMVTLNYTGGQNYAKIMPENSNSFVCACGKKYSHRQGLWKHTKTCYNEQSKLHSVQANHHVEKLDEPTDKQLLMMLIKENSELRKEQSDIKELILEIVKNGTHNTTNNNTTTNNTNSHNKAFNLNFFLNETCKNAMNITDFVDSIKLQLSDFMDVGEVGYIQGISNIIVKKLNALDETIRPIHCTDQKRETFYVKDENKWEKEEEDFNRIRKMIKKVAYKNERLMTSYKEKYPDYNDPQSKRSDHYSKTVIEALGGDGDNYKEKENKIIKNISRATHPKAKN
jgi:hypothetical protein